MNFKFLGEFMPSMIVFYLLTLNCCLVTCLLPFVASAISSDSPSVVPTTFYPTVTGPGWLTEHYYENTTSTIPIAIYGRRTGLCIKGPYDLYYIPVCGTSKINYGVVFCT